MLAWLEEGELRVVGTEVAGRQAQRIACARIGSNVRLADELIADRRAKARREGKNV